LLLPIATFVLVCQGEEISFGSPDSVIRNYYMGLINKDTLLIARSLGGKRVDCRALSRIMISGFAIVDKSAIKRLSYGPKDVDFPPFLRSCPFSPLN